MVRGWGEGLKKIGLILSIIFMIPFFIFFIYSLIPTRYLSEKDMKRDFDYLRDIVEKAYISREKLDDFEKVWATNFRKIRRKMPRMEFYKLASRVVSSLNDDAAGVSFGVPKYMPVMPFEVFPDVDRLFVVKSAIEEIPECSEILRIGGQDSSEIVERLKGYVSSESDLLKYPKVSKLFHLLPMIDRKEKYSVTIVVGDERRTVRFEAPTKLEYFRRLEKLGKIEKPFEFSMEDGKAYLRIGTFSIYRKDLHEYHEILEELEDFDEVILDLRSNMKGSSSRARELVEILIKGEITVRKTYEIRVNPYSKEVLESLGLTGKDGEIVSKNVEISYKPSGNFDGNVIVLIDRFTMGPALEAAYVLKKAGYKIVGEKPLQKLSRNFVFSYHGLPSAGFGLSIPDGRIINEVDELVPDEEFPMGGLKYIRWLCSGKDDLLEQQKLSERK